MVYKIFDSSCEICSAAPITAFSALPIDMDCAWIALIANTGFTGLVTSGF